MDPEYLVSRSDLFWSVLAQKPMLGMSYHPSVSLLRRVVEGSLWLLPAQYINYKVGRLQFSGSGLNGEVAIPPQYLHRQTPRFIA